MGVIESQLWVGDVERILDFARPIYRTARDATLSGILDSAKPFLAMGLDPSFPIFDHGTRSILDEVGKQASSDMLTLLLTGINPKNPNAWPRVMEHLIHSELPAATPIATQAFASGALSPSALLPSGRTVLSECVVAGNRPIFDAALAAGADVNAVDPTGKTALDYAIDLQAADYAGALASKPGFQLRFTECGDPVRDHVRAQWMLKKFVELNLPSAVGQMVQAHHFGWFDLYPLCEWARLQGFSEVYAILTKTQERK